MLRHTSAGARPAAWRACGNPRERWCDRERHAAPGWGRGRVGRAFAPPARARAARRPSASGSPRTSRRPARARLRPAIRRRRCRARPCPGSRATRAGARPRSRTARSTPRTRSPARAAPAPRSRAALRGPRGVPRGGWPAILPPTGRRGRCGVRPAATAARIRRPGAGRPGWWCPDLPGSCRGRARAGRRREIPLPPGLRPPDEPRPGIRSGHAAAGTRRVLRQARTGPRLRPCAAPQ